MMDATSAWTGQDPTLSLASQDDFQQFLDMGNHLGDLNFDFQEFSGQQGAPMMRQDGGDVMDMRMDANHGGLGQHDTIMQEHIPITTASNHASIPSTPLTHGHPSNDSLSDLDAQIQYLQQQRHQQQQRQIQDQQRNYFSQNRPIPPTPNSMEIHAGNSQQFYPQSDPQQQAMYERYQMQVKEQEMAFTPLVSPAVTPLETHFHIPEYTVPGAYFSPLSSPALHAQNEHSSVYEQMQNHGTTNSPIDINLDSHSAPASSSILSNKSSRKTLTKPRTTRTTIRQSPIVKPQRKRKGGSTTAMSPQTLNNRIEPTNAQKGQSTTTTSSTTSTENSNSENGSISPEHLSDMAPPPVPKPGSAGRSPYITAQREGGRSQAFPLGSPATPASLMRITKSPNSTNHNADIDDHAMGGFALPEPATDLGKPPVSRIDTQSDGQITPTLGSTVAKTPAFQPLPSPAFAQPKSTASANQSPQIEAMNGGPIRKTPLLAARGSKKRASVSSVQVSPALRPRISPSIKPLLPGGGSVSNDTASLLLASKSNYQNILEGTHLPGVSYPTELSTNLTSKRTSHKIAEQGRRNRINSALQEIATLLPKGPGKDSSGEKSGDAGDNADAKGSGAAAQSANSKASTVEHAIEFIKLLKKQVEDTEKRAADAERRAEEAEKQLTELKT